MVTMPLPLILSLCQLLGLATTKQTHALFDDVIDKLNQDLHLILADAFKWRQDWNFCGNSMTWLR